MPQVLVTGGSGFFGIPLVKGLFGNGYSVRVIDMEELREPEISSNVDFIKGDIRDKEIVHNACKGVDYLIHNAAIMPISRAKKKVFWEINVGGTRNVLEEALVNHVRKTIFISSSALYGIPKEIPITENTEFNPVCDYGRSKMEAEKVCNEYRDKGLNIIILRPRTIVGRGRLGIFQILYSWIADNKNIYIIGKGDNRFSFLSERDLVSACVLSIKNDCENEDFNLGADGFKTVKEDLQDLITYAGSSSKIIAIPAGLARSVLGVLDLFNLVPFTPLHYKTPDKPFYFDTSKAETILGWHSGMTNSDMLKDSYDFYLAGRKDIDADFGITHKKSVRQKFLRILKKIS